MQKPVLPINEDERSRAIQKLGMIYSPSEARFDRITRLAVGEVQPGSGRAMHDGVRFRIASLTKPVVSLAALMLADEGRLDVATVKGAMERFGIDPGKRRQFRRAALRGQRFHLPGVTIAPHQIKRRCANRSGSAKQGHRTGHCRIIPAKWWPWQSQTAQRTPR